MTTYFIPHAALPIAVKNSSTPTKIGFFHSCFHANPHQASTNYPWVSIPRVNCNPQAIFASTAEEHYTEALSNSMDADEYADELEVAVKAVHMACLLCQKVQESLLTKSSDIVQSKDDNSPVTVAGSCKYGLIYRGRVTLSENKLVIPAFNCQ